MENFGDSAFPYPRFLKVPFVFVPKGVAAPLDWMAEHPGFVTIAATFVPRPHSAPPPEPMAEPDPATEHVVGAGEAKADPSPPVRDDIAHIVPKPLMEGDPRLAQPFPDRLLKSVPPPRPNLPPSPDTRPEWLRRILPPPGPRRPPSKLPDIPAFAAFHAKQRTGADMAARMIDPKGRAAIVRSAMAHLDAHKGEVGAALVAAKAAGPLGW